MKLFQKQIYAERRATLRQKVQGGIILIPGNNESPMNFPNECYYFRQDSTFAYFFGLTKPNLLSIIDTESGEDYLFGDDVTLEDIIWTGPVPSLKDLGDLVGVKADNCLPYKKFYDFVQDALAQNRRIHFLPPYRMDTKVFLSECLHTTVAGVFEQKSVDLMFAVAEMREVKSAEEIEELEEAFKIGYKMHTAAMLNCSTERTEREIAGILSGIAHSGGTGESFLSIVTQHGETLHNTITDSKLQNGKLLLCDAGAEAVNLYCSDHTRTFPISGKFTSKQRDIYETVLRAHDEVIKKMTPGTLYTEVHNEALRLLAEGLRGVGLIKSTPEDAVQSGAMTLFMPHGLGHGLGLDVHDCEAFGERSFDFSKILDRAKESATCIHRTTWRLRENTVMSDEPGIYFIPALIDDCRNKGLYKGIVDYDLLETYKDFGGIRIEDDVIVTSKGSYFTGRGVKIPVTVAELEEELERRAR